MTAIMMTALKTDGRPSIPAFVMAMIKGEATVSTEDFPFKSRSSVYGTRRPTSKRETM